MGIGSKWTIGLGILLVGMNLYQGSRISDLESRIQNVGQHLNVLDRSINNVDSSIANTMREWKLENQWIRESTYNLTGLSQDQEEMTLLVSWQFNQLKQNETVYLMVNRESNEGSIVDSGERILVEPVSDLHYQKEVRLPFKGNYSLEIITVDEQGNKRSAKLDDVDIYQNLTRRLIIDGNIYPKGNGFGVSLNLIHVSYKKIFREQISDPSDTLDKFILKRAMAEIYVGGNLFKEVDLLKESEQKMYPNPELAKEKEFSYNKDFQLDDYKETDLKVIVKAEDYLGITFEKEISYRGH